MANISLSKFFLIEKKSLSMFLGVFLSFSFLKKLPKILPLFFLFKLVFNKLDDENVPEFVAFN